MKFNRHLPAQSQYAILFLINSVYYMIMAAVMPYLPAYYRLMEFSLFQIGILTAVGPFCSIFMQPVWSYWSDRLGNRLVILRIVLAGSMAGLFLMLFPHSFFGLFITVSLFQSFFTAILPIQDAIVLTFCNQSGRSYASIRVGGTIGYALLVVFAGILAGIDMRFSFVAGALGFGLILVLTRMMPSDDSSVARKRLDSIGSLLKNHRLVALLLFIFFYQIGLSFLFGFLSLHIIDIGLASQYIGLAMLIAASCEMPVLFLIERVLKKIAPAKVILFSGFMLSVRLLILSQSQDFIGIAIAQTLNGVTYMSVYYSALQFVNREVRTEMKATGLGLLALIQSGLSVIFSSILGGYLADLFSIRTVLTYDALFMLLLTAGGVILYTLRHRIPFLQVSAQPGPADPAKYRNEQSFPDP